MKKMMMLFLCILLLSACESNSQQSNESYKMLSKQKINHSVGISELDMNAAENKKIIDVFWDNEDGIYGYETKGKFFIFFNEKDKEYASFNGTMNNKVITFSFQSANTKGETKKSLFVVEADKKGQYDQIELLNNDKFIGFDGIHYASSK